MTRLTTDDIKDIRLQLIRHDDHLVSVTGQTLLGIGAAASGCGDVSFFQRVAPKIKMAVVPIRGGLGIISGFTETVCGILAHLGFDAAVTGHSDVAGFADAVDAGVQIIMAADDDRFVAFCPRQGRTVDNSHATARGFVAGLDFMAGGLHGQAVLVVGCGPVGRWAVEALLTRQANVCVYDRVADRAGELAQWARGAFQTTIQVALDADQALMTHPLIVDATNAAEVIHAGHVSDRTRVAAPGMPCGVTLRAQEKLTGRFLHDPLQIGVAAMACEAVCIIHDRSFPARPIDREGESA